MAGTKRTFEIRHTEAGFEVRATTTGRFGRAAGIATPEPTPFATEAAAITWAETNFDIPSTAWTRRADDVLEATK